MRGAVHLKAKRTFKRVYFLLISPTPTYTHWDDLTRESLVAAEQQKKSWKIQPFVVSHETGWG
jgi:hypothetical protein